MNVIRGRHALVTALLVAGLAAGCSDGDPRPAGGEARQPSTATTPAPAEFTMVENGYPIARDLRALVDFPDVDTIVVVTGVTPGEPTWIGKPGGVEEDAPGSWIVTPAEATVTRVFRGTAQAGEPIRFAFSGGRIGKYEAVSTDETSAQLPEVAGYTRLVLAGDATTAADGSGLNIEPYFVYGLGDDNRAESLLESAGEVKRPSFSIASLRDAALPR